MNLHDLIDYNLHHYQNVFFRNDKKDIISVYDSFLRIFYLNARSLNSKIEEIQTIITSTKVVPDIIAISETWIPNDSIEYFKMNGYISFLAGRKDKKGGGVGILVKQNLGTPKILEQFMSNTIEFISIEVKISKEIYRITTIYRPPSTLNEQDQQLFLNKMDYILEKYSGKNSYIIGDMNINIMKNDSCFIQSYLNNIHSNNQTIVNEGYITRPSSNSCLDHLISDIDIANDLYIQTLNFLNLDHLVMFIDIPIKSKLNINHTYQVKKILNYENLKEKIPEALCHINQTMDVNEIFNEMVNGMKNCIKECSSIKVYKRNTKYKSEWIDKELIEAIDSKEF